MGTLSRSQILDTLRAALAPNEYILAAWEAGSAAFGRVDEWSDIDLQLIVPDDRVEEAFSLVGETLETLSPIALSYRLPEPTWHGHSQCFYRLRDAGEFLLIDLAIVKESSKERFLEPAQHGTPIVLFDKAGLVVPPEEKEEPDELRRRVAELKTTFFLFQCLPKKEILRGNAVEALAFYHSCTLRPLVELFRIRHCPARRSFAVRYLKYDLPEEVQQQIQTLYFVKDLEEVRQKRELAETLFSGLLSELEAG